MSKYKFKRLLKNQIQVKRREFLENLKSVHSKTRKLEIEENPKEYLTTKFLSVSEKQFLFSLKCNMSTNKVNFKQMHFDLNCRLCKDQNSEESLVYLSVCSFVRRHVPDICKISVDDFYGNIEDQIRAVQIWKKAFSYIENLDNN